MTRSSQLWRAGVMAAFLFVSASVVLDAKPVDPCSLLTPAEIQEALGKTVQAGKLKTHASPAAGADCNFVVGDIGSFNVLVKPLAASETAARIKAEFVKMKMNPVDLPNVGDSSFFTSPGYGMVQLHTLKGSSYFLFTILVPGVEEKALQSGAAKLMLKLLSKL